MRLVRGSKNPLLLTTTGIEGGRIGGLGGPHWHIPEPQSRLPDIPLEGSSRSGRKWAPRKGTGAPFSRPVFSSSQLQRDGTNLLLPAQPSPSFGPKKKKKMKEEEEREGEEREEEQVRPAFQEAASSIP